MALLFGLRSRWELSVVCLINLVTNPALNVAAAAVGFAAAAAYPPFVAVAEACVVLGEWRLMVWALGGPSMSRLALSLTMNGASLLLGLALWAI